MPDFLIIGAAKSGTTSLYNWIAAHPQVMLAAKKEVHFFNSNKCTRPMSKLWYRSHFPNVLHKQYLSIWHNHKILTGEASPSYLASPRYQAGNPAPGRIKTALPNVKLIVILRNPVDRVYSNYHMYLRNRDEFRTFEDAIHCDYTAPAGFSYLRRGHYAEHLELWFEHFDRDRFLILTLDELKADQQGTLGRVFDFLGLEPRMSPFPPPRNRLSDTDAWANRVAGGAFGEGNLPGTGCQIRTHGQKWKRVYNMYTYPKMNPDTRRMLVGYYRPHNERLSRLLGRDFDWDR